MFRKKDLSGGAEVLIRGPRNIRCRATGRDLEILVCTLPYYRGVPKVKDRGRAINNFESE